MCKHKSDLDYVEHRAVGRRAYYHKKMEWLYHVKTGGCSRCGESEPCCIDFHHRDPTTKDEDVTRILNRHNIKAAWDEIGKCEMLCSNCHRKLHKGLI